MRTAKVGRPQFNGNLFNHQYSETASKKINDENNINGSDNNTNIYIDLPNHRKEFTSTTNIVMKDCSDNVPTQRHCRSRNTSARSHLPPTPDRINGRSVTRSPIRNASRREDNGRDELHSSMHGRENISHLNSAGDLDPQTLTDGSFHELSSSFDFGRRGTKDTDCGGSNFEVPQASVSELKNWLVDFEKKNKSHFEKSNVSTSKRPEGMSSAKTLLREGAKALFSESSVTSPGPFKNQSVSECNFPRSHSLAASNNLTKSPYTPAQRRFKPKIKKDDVAAKNDSRASVQKISAWLSDDPFETKKTKQIKKSVNIIRKSRKFEPDQPSPVGKVIESQIKGNVTDRKKWVENGFKISMENDEVNKMGTVSERAKWLKDGAFSKNQDIGSRPENGDHFTYDIDEGNQNNHDNRDTAETACNSIKPNEGNAEYYEEHIKCGENEKMAVSERASWLKNKAFKNEVGRDVSVEIDRCVAVSDRANWLKNEAFSKNANKSSMDEVLSDFKDVTVSDKAKWLREEAFQKRR